MTYKEQDILQKLVHEANSGYFDATKNRYLVLPESEFMRGAWYQSHTPASPLDKHIVVLHDNYIVGNVATTIGFSTTM